MSEHRVTLNWDRGGRDFNYKSYSRDHTWTFEGGVRIDASAAAAYLGNADLVDPEEAFVASLSSCHMLWFLSIAAKQHFCVDHYRDSAVGWMEKAPDGRPAMTRVTLRPQVQFSGDPLPTRRQLDEMHHQAHEACFIANSVKTEVACEPLYTTL